MRVLPAIGKRARAAAPAVGRMLLLSGLFMLVPCAISLVRGERDLPGLGLSAAAALALGLGAIAAGGRRQRDLDHRDAIFVVVLSWLAAGLLGALPFLLTGALSPIDALFESISGFTTTGASVVIVVEDLPAGLLFWRSLTHWLGGMGIIVLAVAVLPFLGSSGYRLLKSESPVFAQDKWYPRMARTARAIFLVYAAITAAETILLAAGGMSLFDALAHAFGTIATGGFSTRTQSIAAYGSVYIEAVVTIFMILASLPFVVHYRGLRRPRAYLESVQARVHLVLLGTICLVVSLELWGRGVYAGAAEAFRYGTFQIVSLMTTTGFATADSEQWTAFARFMLVIVMFIGGCTGSTSGAIKTFRIIVCFKLARRQLLLLTRRRAIHPIRIGSEIIEEETAARAAVFLVAYLLVALLGAFGLMLFGLDGLTAISATAATLGGVGPGLGSVGPVDNYAWMPVGAKAICILLMILGRLEIFTFVVVFTRQFWR